MSVKVAEKSMTAALAENLADSGFVRANNYLIARRQGDVEMQIRCAGRKDKQTGTVFITLNFGIRFDSIEQLLRRSDDFTFPTVISQISIFHHTLDAGEWDAANPDTPALLAAEVNAHAIPLFERYGNLDTMIEALENCATRDLPFLLHPRDRILVLAAALAIRHGKPAAVSLLNRRIAELGRSSVSADRRLCPSLLDFRERLLRFS